MNYDSSGWDREPFNGSGGVPSSSRRRAYGNHGPSCSSDPEVGCECGEEEREHDRAERAEARRFPNAAAEGVVMQRWLVVDGTGRVLGDWMSPERAARQAREANASVVAA